MVFVFSTRWRHGEPAVVDPWQAGPPDEYGDPAGMFGDRFTIEKTAFAPGQSELDTTGHSVHRVETTPTLYTPPGVRITAGSRVTIRGKTFEAVSDSKVWVSPYSGVEAGSTTDLKEVT